MKRLIAFAGRAGSGKSTAARYLVRNYGFERIRFAGPLKDMMRALGLSEEEVDGGLKEQPCELLGGKTPRFAMQTLGTEWGRELIAPDLWTQAWIKQAERHPFVVCDDVRFPNEQKLIRELGGTLIRIDAEVPGAAPVQHASEAMDFPMDRVVVNRFDDAFFRVLDAVMADVR